MAKGRVAPVSPVSSPKKAEAAAGPSAMEPTNGVEKRPAGRPEVKPRKSGGSFLDRLRGGARGPAGSGQRKVRERRASQDAAEYLQLKEYKRMSRNYGTPGPLTKIMGQMRTKTLEGDGEESEEEKIPHVERSGDSMWIERKKVLDDLDALTAFMMNPLSSTRIAWDAILLVVTISNAFRIPYYIAFQPYQYCSDAQEENMKWLDFASTNAMCYSQNAKAFDFFVHAVFLVDILINTRTGFVNAQAQIVMNGKEALVHYLKGWFVLDLVSMVPVDMILASQIDGGHIEVKLVQMIKLLKVGNMTRVLDKAARANTFRVVRVIIALVLLGHVIGCCYFYLSRYQIDYYAQNGCNRSTGCPWTVQEGITDANLYTQYASAMYWGMTMLTSVEFGYVEPKTNMEKFFAASCQLVGAICTALIFGEVAALIQNAEGGNRKYRSLIAATNYFLRFHNIPKALRRRVKNTIEYGYTVQSGVDRESVLVALPPHLRAEVLAHVYKNVTSKCMLFKKCNKNFLKEMSLRFSSMFFLPGEIIYEYGDAGRDVYFVSRGKVKVISGQGGTMGMLTQGDHFGEIGYFDGTRRSATVKAMGHTELYIIAGDDLDEILTRFPEYAKIMKEAARTTLQKRKLEGILTAPGDLPDALQKPRLQHLKSRIAPWNEQTPPSPKGSGQLHPLPPPPSAPGASALSPRPHGPPRVSVLDPDNPMGMGAPGIASGVGGRLPSMPEMAEGDSPERGEAAAGPSGAGAGGLQATYAEARAHTQKLKALYEAALAIEQGLAAQVGGARA